MTDAAALTAALSELFSWVLLLSFLAGFAGAFIFRMCAYLLDWLLDGLASRMQPGESFQLLALLLSVLFAAVYTVAAVRGDFLLEFAAAVASALLVVVWFLHDMFARVRGQRS